MTLSDLIPSDPTFCTHADVVDSIRAACTGSPLVSWHELGESEEGRPIDGIVLGDGPVTVSLIAGNHADVSQREGYEGGRRL